jgi:hypothetical protein
MAETNIGGALEQIELKLKSNPPQAQEALKELENVLRTSGHDPRANLYQALALSLVGEKDRAVQYAQLASRVAQDIHQEASALLERLPKK